MAIKKKTAKIKAKKATSGRKMKAPTKAPAIKKALAQNATTTKKQVSFPSSPITAKQSKAQIYTELATITGLPKSDVKNIFAALKNVVERNIKGKGIGEFVIPELAIKVRRIQKKASKARMGRNPFTGEEIQIPAKPARKSVKATALKGLKELV